MKLTQGLVITLLSWILVSPSLAGGAPEPGCYTPVKGFATSTCLDSYCSKQEGVYHILLQSDSHKLKLRGNFKGYIVGSPNECRGFTLNHLFVERRYKGTLTSAGDQVCPLDDPNTPALEVSETIHLQTGNGIYGGLESGTLELTGTINLATGTNTFKVVPGAGEICFADDGNDSTDDSDSDGDSHDEAEA